MSDHYEMQIADLEESCREWEKRNEILEKQVVTLLKTLEAMADKCIDDKIRLISSK